MRQASRIVTTVQVNSSLRFVKLPDISHAFTFVLQPLDKLAAGPGRRACVVSFQGAVYESRDAVAAGLRVVGQVANITCQVSTTQFLQRYVSDLLTSWCGSALELSAIAKTKPSFIAVQFVGCGLAQGAEQVSVMVYDRPVGLSLYLPTAVIPSASCIVFNLEGLGGVFTGICSCSTKLSQIHEA